MYIYIYFNVQFLTILGNFLKTLKSVSEAIFK